MKKSSLNLKWMFLMLLLAAAMPVFAADVLPSGLKTLAEGIRDIFLGDFVKIILVICFCGCAVAYAFNKDNEKIKRNALAVGIATAILGVAQFTVNKIFESSLTQ